MLQNLIQFNKLNPSILKPWISLFQDGLSGAFLQSKLSKAIKLIRYLSLEHAYKGFIVHIKWLGKTVLKAESSMIRFDCSVSSVYSFLGSLDWQKYFLYICEKSPKWSGQGRQETLKDRKEDKKGRKKDTKGKKGQERPN